MLSHAMESIDVAAAVQVNASSCLSSESSRELLYSNTQVAVFLPPQDVLTRAGVEKTSADYLSRRKRSRQRTAN